MLSLAFCANTLNFRLVVCYGDKTYQQEATLYYTTHNNTEFDEEHSIYSYAAGGKVYFDYKADFDRIFIIPNRQLGMTVKISSVKLMADFVPIFTASGEKLDTLVYSNKEEQTAVYENKMLTLVSSEQNQYPRLVFADELNQKINRLANYSEQISICMALICTLIFSLLYFVLERFILKYSRIMAFYTKNSTAIKFLSIIFVFVLSSMCFFNGYNVVIDYETNLEGSESIIYFDYDDDGFKESNSKYTKINSLSGENVFYTVSNVEGLRFIPNRMTDTKARIKAVRLFHEGIPVKTYTAEMLQKQYLSNSDIVVEDNCIIVETTSKQQQYPILTFNQKFLDELNTPTPTVIVIDVLKVLAFCAFLLFSNFVYQKGRLHKQKYFTKIKGRIKTVFTVCIVTAILCALLGIKSLVYAVMPFILLLFIYALGTDNSLNSGKTIIYTPVCAILSAVILFNMNSGLFARQAYFAFAFWCCVLFGMSTICFVCTLQRLKGNFKQNKKYHIENISGFFVKILIAVFIYELVKTNLQSDYCSMLYVTEMMLGDVLQLNIMLLFAFACTIYGLLGKAWTNTLYSVMYFVILAGNTVKLQYHNTMLTPTDFFQLKDALAIAPDIMGEKLYYLVIGVFVLLVILLLVNIKRIISAMRPRPFWWGFAISAVLLVLFGRGIIDDKYIDINVCDKPYIDEITSESTNGIAIYNMFKIKHIPDMMIKAPDDYNEHTINELNAEFEGLGKDTDNVRPNVICVLAESFVDLNDMEELAIDEDIIPFTREHGFSTMISPHYGGYTAAVEYEVLTGMTLAFYPPAVIPYTSYYNNEEKVIPSVPQTFADNGYKTYAIHPNTANFYGRNKAYKMMGIQEYWAIDEFKNAEQVKNRFVRDDEVANKIIKTIENNFEPVFTFAITMESHSTSDIRFDETLFDVNAEMSERDKAELEQQATAYRDTDTMIEKLVEYIDNCDEPTLLYVFGDHMPPLSAFGNLNYINDINNKYSTIALCHSNYKEIEIKDRITPNYIAAQMIIDSGVEHSAYFNYIYDLRKRLPVLHRNFIEINTEQNEDLRTYYQIQYDIMFGKQWFYKKEYP